MPDLNRFTQWLKTAHPETVTEPEMLPDLAGGDPGFASSLVDAALETFDRFEQDLKGNNRESYLAVHSLKSTLTSLGMSGAADRFYQTEKKLKTNDPVPDSEWQALNQVFRTARQVTEAMKRQLHPQ